MSSHSSSQSIQEGNVSVSIAGDFDDNLPESLRVMGDFAHRKITPAIARARSDDNKQEAFTSAATNLATGGLIMAKLTLRMAGLHEKRV